ncbi:MAG TPA: DoxX family protein [Polyangiales bacterium]|nr:DoxX family protein [Polyangiales bacterium]
MQSALSRLGGLRAVLYVAATAVAAAAFLGSGLANLAHVPHVVDDMAHLGYPSYFMTVLGTWKVLGAIGIVVPRFPRLKEWSYAGMMFDLTGAASSRAAMGDGAVMVLVPLAIAAVVVTSWALRPIDRRVPLRAAA